MDTFISCLALLGIFHSVPFASACTSECPAHNVSDLPKFNNDLGTGDSIRQGRPQSILCCASGYTNMTWLHEENGSYHVITPTDRRQICDNDQVLHIEKVGMEDAGNYRCVARKEDNSATFNFTLTVYPCPEFSSKPIPIRVPRSTTSAEIGKTIAIECSADFGCSDLSVVLAIWQHIPSLQPVKNDSLFTVIDIDNRNKTSEIIGKRLTFTMTPELLDKSFKCTLGTPGNFLMYNTTMVSKDTKMIVPLYVIILSVTAFVFVAILVLAMIVVKGRYGPQISFWLDKKFNYLPTRKKNLEYDACVLSAPSSEEFAESNLVLPLRDKYHYRVFHVDNINFGAPYAASMLDGISRSHTAILLVAESDVPQHQVLDEHHADADNHEAIERDFYNRYAAEIQGGKRLIVVRKGCVKEVIKGMSRELGDLIKLAKTVKWTEEVNTSSCHKKNFSCFVNTSSRHKKNFWCSIRRNLPKPMRTENMEPEDANPLLPDYGDA